MNSELKPAIRCAIYTRKSSEEGLEQSFNSLDAQRESCEAFIGSQRHEGWKTLPARYDDGGFSGGNMDRPGLKRLLQDVEAGKVNVIVVYKIDRLTRSLADFAKIVETESFTLAARALGLDCGPMGGFDRSGVDKEFFAGTAIKSNFLCAMGHGNPAVLHPRAPRLSFDQACKIL